MAIEFFFRMDTALLAQVNANGMDATSMAIDWGDGTVNGGLNMVGGLVDHDYADFRGWAYVLCHAEDPDIPLWAETWQFIQPGVAISPVFMVLHETPQPEPPPSPEPIPDFTGCDWPIDDSCLPAAWDDLDPAVQERSLALASNTLQRLTGYRVGGCPITVRPCRSGCTGGRSVTYYPYGDFGWYSPYLDTAGQWHNGCGCLGDCSCTEMCVVRLPAPVGRVDEVKVDGTVVPPTDYTLYGADLTWTGDGDCPWPVCQDLTKPDTEPGTFSVTYLNSYPVDGLGAYAAGTLAWEYAQACTGGQCRLPANVTAVTRMGISYEMATGAFPDGFTGIREVDAYIALWNPHAVGREARVWTPDMPRVYH